MLVVYSGNARTAATAALMALLMVDHAHFPVFAWVITVSMIAVGSVVALTSGLFCTVSLMRLSHRILVLCVSCSNLAQVVRCMWLGRSL